MTSISRENGVRLSNDLLEQNEFAKEDVTDINIDKTKMLGQKICNQIDEDTVTEGDTIQVIDNFVYFGVNIQKTVSEGPEIQSSFTMYKFPLLPTFRF